ncbi:hypothetical protein GsuE55_30950 [Geobacillus subterraneus]|uniref:Uncharacterized protein n=1 Tax=Geobacillus subterraneus TaxID=129338 RepID=A0A679FNS8_9BACL|nr:hypothetical protein GsuE55_30950 [Geobacillus subterraneus]
MNFGSVSKKKGLKQLWSNGLSNRGAYGSGLVHFLSIDAMTRVPASKRRRRWWKYITARFE